MQEANQTLSYAQPSFTGLIGVARADITPPIGIYARNWGAAQWDAAEGIHQPLTATALTLQQNADSSPLVLVALDLGWWRSREDEWFLRGGLIEALGLNTTQVMICLSHTHAGPVICRGDAEKPGGHLIASYLQHLQNAVIQTTRQALDTRQLATITWRYGKCGLAQNRDLRDPTEPRYLCGFHPQHPADDTLLVGRVTKEGGELLVTIVNYACHPVTLAWENRLISPDYIGAMREVVEAQTDNVLCLFLQGASGELAPREQYSGNVKLADQHGRELGYAVLSTLEGMLPPQTSLAYTHVVESGAPLAVWESQEHKAAKELKAHLLELELPLKVMPTAQEIEAQMAACTDRAQGERLRRKLQVRRSVGDGSSAMIPAWLWQIGGALFVGHPNEAYSLLQTHLRQSFPEQAVAVMNVVNGWSGYLPPSELYAEDIYPVWQTPFDRGSLERLIEACEQRLSDISSND